MATRADLTLARQLLGYRPTLKLDEALRRHLQWLSDLPDEQLRSLPESLELV